MEKQMNTAVKTTAEKKADSFSVMLTDKLNALGQALPKEVNKTRFVNNALSLLNSKPELAKANKNQLMLCLCKGALLGLDFMSGECYAIPYGEKVNFQTDYKGEIKLAMRYGKKNIKSIVSDVVKEGDKFNVDIVDNEPKINFEKIPFNDKEIVGVFAYVVYEDNSCDYVTLSKTEVNTIRSNYSKAQNSTAWKNSWDEMAKKTAIRRLCKRIIIDFENAEQVMAWEEGSDFQVKQQRQRDEREVPNIFEQPNVVEAEVVDAEESK